MAQTYLFVTNNLSNHGLEKSPMLQIVEGNDAVRSLRKVIYDWLDTLGLKDDLDPLTAKLGGMKLDNKSRKASSSSADVDALSQMTSRMSIVDPAGGQSAAAGGNQRKTAERERAEEQREAERVRNRRELAEAERVRAAEEERERQKQAAEKRAKEQRAKEQRAAAEEEERQRAEEEEEERQRAADQERKDLELQEQTRKAMELATQNQKKKTGVAPAAAAADPETEEKAVLGFMRIVQGAQSRTDLNAQDKKWLTSLFKAVFKDDIPQIIVVLEKHIHAPKDDTQITAAGFDAIRTGVLETVKGAQQLVGKREEKPTKNRVDAIKWIENWIAANRSPRN